MKEKIEEQINVLRDKRDWLARDLIKKRDLAQVEYDSRTDEVDREIDFLRGLLK